MCALKSLMSQVLSNTSLNGFFGTKTRAGGGSPPPLAPAPPAPPHTFPAEKCGERIHLVVIYIYIYIINFAGNSTCFVARIYARFTY